MKLKLKHLAIKEDHWLSVLKGAAIVGSAAMLTYAAENLGNMDFGKATEMVVAFLAVAINYARKVVANADLNDSIE